MGEYIIILNKKALMFIIAFAFVLAIAGTSAATSIENNQTNINDQNVSEDLTSCEGCDPIINGTVIIEEYDRNRPLENATVTVSSNSGRILGMATTDENGYYSISFFSAESIFKVTASYMGCNAITNNNVPVTLNLTDNIAYGTANFLLTPIEAEYLGLGSYRNVYMRYYYEHEGSAAAYGPAGVMRVLIEGEEYTAFCIDIYTPISAGNTLLLNGPLPGTAGDLPAGIDWGKVNYIVKNYVTDSLSSTEASAIQCAIWYFTSAPYGVYPGDSQYNGYYQFMTYSPRYISGLTRPYDGVRRSGLTYYYDVYNRAWEIIDAAQSVNYPSQITTNPETVRIPNGGNTSITSTVKDQHGTPMSGITVNFSTSSGSFSSSSSVTTTTATTNGDGQAIVTLYAWNNNDTSATVTAWAQLQEYGTLLYDDYLNPKQNLVVADIVPHTLQAISIVNFDVTANVALSQTSTTPVNVGDTVTYVVTATNNGPNTATGILIRDIAPDGLINVTITPSNGAQYYNLNTGVWTIPSLENGASVTLTITGTTTASLAGLIINNTAARISQDQFNNLSNTATTQVYCKALPDLSINMYTLNGDTTAWRYNMQIPYIIEITNNGNDANNVIVETTLPTGLKHIASSVRIGGNCTYYPETNKIIWTIDYLPAKSGAILDYILRVTEIGTLTNTANVTAIIAEKGTKGTKNASWAIGIADNADVEVTQNATIYEPGKVKITIKVKNNGPTTASNIAIQDTLPNGLTMTNSDTHGNGTYINGLWTIGTMDLNDTFTLDIYADITGTGNIINTAYKTRITGTRPTPDWNTTNNGQSTYIMAKDS